MNAQNNTTNVTTAASITFWAAWAVCTMGLVYLVNEKFGMPVALATALPIGSLTFALILMAWVILPAQTKQAIAALKQAQLARAMQQEVAK